MGIDDENDREIACAFASGEIKYAWDTFVKPWDDLIERWVLEIDRKCPASTKVELLSDVGMPLLVVFDQVRRRLSARWRQQQR